MLLLTRSFKKYAVQFISCLFAFLFIFFALPAVMLQAEAQIKLTVHYIEAQPIPGKTAYKTQVYFSLLDPGGNPVSTLDASQLSLSEDSQKVEIKALSQASDLPIHLVMAVDTSGSMLGSNISEAKKAASGFISRLKADDQLALLSFNQDITHVQDFSADKALMTQKLQGIQAQDGAGTCLYDAAVKAVQTASTLPSGQRAVVLLTDGVDEKAQGGACSQHTIDDVINMASGGGTRVPIYTIGLGNRTDVKGLQRLAVNTGGQYLYAPDAQSLEGLFARLSSQLSSQYLLEYESNAAPGAHTLVLSVNLNSASDQDSRNFVLPALPISISINEPTEGVEIGGGTVKITAILNGQGDEPVKQVVFSANGVEIGRDDTTPYEFTWTPGADARREETITASVLGASGKELAKTERHFFLETGGAAEENTTAQGTASPAATPVVIVITPAAGAGILGSTNNIFILFGLVGVLILLVVVILVVVLRRKPEKTVTGPGRSASSHPGQGGSLESDPPLANLTVQFSDDPATNGKVIPITKTVTTFGRSAGADIIFEKDPPVSRLHAAIEQKGSTFVFYELNSLASDGKMKRPTYGTFLNDLRKVGLEPVELKTGDVLRLGTRLKLRFEPVVRMVEEGGVTLDGIEEGGTFDGLLPPAGDMETMGENTTAHEIQVEKEDKNEETLSDDISDDKTEVDGFSFSQDDNSPTVTD